TASPAEACHGAPAHERAPCPSCDSHGTGVAPSSFSPLLLALGRWHVVSRDRPQSQPPIRKPPRGAGPSKSNRKPSASPTCGSQRGCWRDPAILLRLLQS